MLWSESHSWRSGRIGRSSRYYCGSINWGTRDSTNIKNFHTGGVFTGGTAEHVRAPSNGKMKFNEDLVHPTRTRHGHPAFLCYIDLYVSHY